MVVCWCKCCWTIIEKYVVNDTVNDGPSAAISIKEFYTVVVGINDSMISVDERVSKNFSNYWHKANNVVRNFASDSVNVDTCVSISNGVSDGHSESAFV